MTAMSHGDALYVKVNVKRAHSAKNMTVH